MGRKLVLIFILVITSLLLWNCAQIGTLSGGKKDTTPPVLLLALPELKTTNFNSDLITLKFDENVQLVNLQKELMISPRINSQPDIEALGKKVIIKLKKEDLAPNTTYRFYFGKAIADMHERNPIANFSYIFSTGPNIDTVKLEGNVFDAFTMENEKNVKIGLYFNENLNDSFPYKQIPDYVTESDDKGKFEIGNLPERTFRLIGFTDKNKNNIYDGSPSEKIGFIKGSFELKSDTIFSFPVFEETNTRLFIKKATMLEKGRALVLFNKKVFSDVQPLDSRLNTDFYMPKREAASDSCMFYYKGDVDSLHFIIKYSDESNFTADTFHLKVPFISPQSKKRMVSQSNIIGGLNYFSQANVQFNHWIDTLNSRIDAITLYRKKDSLIKIDSLRLKWNPNGFSIINRLKAGDEYLLKIDSAALVSYYGFKNDSIYQNFNVLGESKFGQIHLKVIFNKKQSYLIELLNSSNKVIRSEKISFSLSSSNEVEFAFKDLEEDNYRLKIYYDDNANEKWDTGNLIKELYPEKIYIHSKPLKATAGWESEEEIKLTE